MDNKHWWQSKGVMAGVVAVVVAAYNGIQPALCEQFTVCLPMVPEWAYMLLGSLGVYGRVTAKTAITK